MMSMMTTVYRPEKALRVICGASLLIWGLLSLGLLLTWDTSDGGWWVVILTSGTLAVLSARGLLVRVVPRPRGIEVVNQWSHRRYDWRDIERFEVTEWHRRACIVTKDGRRHRLSGQQKSIAESLMGRANHTDDVVDALNDMLNRRARRP